MSLFNKKKHRKTYLKLYIDMKSEGLDVVQSSRVAEKSNQVQSRFLINHRKSLNLKYNTKTKKW